MSSYNVLLNKKNNKSRRQRIQTYIVQHAKESAVEILVEYYIPQFAFTIFLRALAAVVSFCRTRIFVSLKKNLVQDGRSTFQGRRFFLKQCSVIYFDLFWENSPEVEAVLLLERALSSALLMMLFALFSWKYITFTWCSSRQLTSRLRHCSYKSTHENFEQGERGLSYPLLFLLLTLHQLLQLIVAL